MSDGYYWRLKVQPGRKGYNPNQPRVPAGNSEGGRWTSSGGQFTVIDSDEFPDMKVYTAKRGQKLPDDVLYPEYNGEMRPIVVAPDGSVSVAKGPSMHGPMIRALGYGVEDFDNIARVSVNAGGRAKHWLSFKTEYLGFGLPYNPPYSQDEEARIQDMAGKKLGKVARALIGAGYDPSLPCRWEFWTTGKRTLDTLAGFSEYKEKRE